MKLIKIIKKFRNGEKSHYLFFSDSEVTDGHIEDAVERWCDEEYFYKRIHITDKEKNTSETFTEQVEKFSLGDFTDMLSYQGLQIEHVFGDYDLDAYHIKKSPRMIIMAKKIHQ